MFTPPLSSNHATTSAQYIEIEVHEEQIEEVTQAQHIGPDERIKQLALSDYENNNNQSFREALNALKIRITSAGQSDYSTRFFRAQNIQINTHGVGVYIHNALLNKVMELEEAVAEEIDRLIADIIKNRVAKDIVKTDGSFSLFDEFLKLKYDICPQLMQAVHTLAQHDYAIENFAAFNSVERTVEHASTRLNRAKLHEEIRAINKWPYIIKFIASSLSFSMVWILYFYIKQAKGNSFSIWPVVVASITYTTSLLFLSGDIWTDSKKSKTNIKINHFNVLDSLYKKIHKEHERTWGSVLLHTVDSTFRASSTSIRNMSDDALVDLFTQRAAYSDNFKQLILEIIPPTS